MMTIIAVFKREGTSYAGLLDRETIIEILTEATDMVHLKLLSDEELADVLHGSLSDNDEVAEAVSLRLGEVDCDDEWAVEVAD